MAHRAELPTNLDEAADRYAATLADHALDQTVPVLGRVAGILELSGLSDRMASDVVRRLERIEPGQPVLVRTLGGLAIGIHAGTESPWSIQRFPVGRYQDSPTELGLRFQPALGRVINHRRTIWGVGYGGGGSSIETGADVQPQEGYEGAHQVALPMELRVS
jgi:hypothetical protein